MRRSSPKPYALIRFGGLSNLYFAILIIFFVLLAIYPKESYENYSKDPKKQSLMKTKNIKIVKITQSIKGKDTFNKTRIQLKIYASSPNVKTKEEKESAGDRINYNVRKNIANSFKTENISNKLFNPAFSNKYSFTTANVVWV